MRGKLALAGIDLRVSAACWFDAAYAIVMEAPTEALEKMADRLAIASARARPDRETWGMTPEQQEMMARAAKGGARHGGTVAPPRRTRGNGGPV